ncbi:hypothetical protein WUBG_05893 [Wuchereria bancrofti]|uniref:Transmembrane protein 138 n=1 Tax=Wuchereria bancrofti TaxID=6293 RepID=J9B816_WUCBA|nr:hypothetical protein WUBG_05893 [Wuchereria bancrofti]
MANKYGILLLVQICMMLLDLTFNILDILITTDNTVQLMLHLLQDALIVLSIIIILIAFSSTFVFQAGLITLLLKKFASTIILSLIYLALSALLHFYDMRQRWTTTYQNKWSMIFLHCIFCNESQQYYIISQIKEPYYCYQIRNIIMIQNGFVNKYVKKINSIELCITNGRRQTKDRETLLPKMRYLFEVVDLAPFYFDTLSGNFGK